MRFSAICSRVKLCVSSSTVEGNFVTAVGRASAVPSPAAAAVELVVVVEDDHRNTLPSDCQKDEFEAGMDAVLSELERSVSTAALMQ